MKEKRRDFITDSALAAAGLALTGGRSFAGPRTERPNILIVLDDQERYPMHTTPQELPQRERLKSTSIEFANTYCSYPLCSPSRSTILTGLYPHQTAIMGNADFNQKAPSLSADIPNLGNVFKNAGYETGYFGKWHLTREILFGRRVLGNYGFTDDRVNNQIFGFGGDSRLAREVTRWIRSRKNEKPWIMVYSPVNPHDICYPDMSHLYRGVEKRNVKIPPNYEEDLSDHPEGHWRFKRDDKFAKLQMPKDREGFKDYLRFYMHLIELVDRNLGRVLDALEESGQWDNTLIIFTSDHGEMGGSHGLVNKGFIYEECMRIPLWISAPWLISKNVVKTGFVTNTDLAPTIAASAGVRWPTQLSGRNLLDPQSEAPSYIFCEGGTSGDIKYNIPWRGIISKEWKYCLWLNGEEELYHRTEDPLEMSNLASDLNALDIKDKLRRKVNDWRRATEDPLRELL